MSIFTKPLLPTCSARGVSLGVLILAVAGCASVPNGPSMTVLPGGSASLQQFSHDEAQCHAHAANSPGAGAGVAAANASGMDQAATATVVGAAIGALLGAASDDAGAGAAFGAGAGLLFGSASAADSSLAAGGHAQSRYDSAYVQCMYALGHQVPIAANMSSNYAATSSHPATYTSAPAPTARSTYPPAGTPAPTVITSQPPPGTPPPPGY